MHFSPNQHATLARRHLQVATRHREIAQRHPDDYRADLAARTHARDAYRHATLAEQQHLPCGVIIRTAH